jgi:hypothetical protein
MARIPHGDGIKVTVRTRRRFDEGTPVVSNDFDEIIGRQSGRRAIPHGVGVFSFGQLVHDGAHDRFE